jgi:hypothetical protein
VSMAWDYTCYIEAYSAWPAQDTGQQIIERHSG